MIRYFTYGPLIVWALMLGLFAWPVCRRWYGRLAVFLALGACYIKFFAYAHLCGGTAFVPSLPAGVIWAWNWAYSGAMILFALSVVFWLAWLLGLRRRLGCRPLRYLPLLAWSMSAVGLYNGLKPPVIRELSLSVPNLPAALEGYRIVQLTDLHISASARRWRTEAVVARANAVQADLMVVTGDIVDGVASRLFPEVEPLKNLSAKDGVYFVTGNHEAFYGWSSWKRRYDELGLRFLQDECVFPHASLALAGINDQEFNYRLRRGQASVEALFANATNGEFRVLLQHRPAGARENVARGGINLQLSGHTHGGAFPIARPLVARGNDGFVLGLYPLDPDGFLYVAPGTGQWAGFPMRFFNDPEISVITLHLSP